MKNCIVCLLDLDTTLFSKSKKTCDTCVINKKREYNQRYYAANKDKLLDQASQYYENNKRDILTSSRKKNTLKIKKLF